MHQDATCCIELWIASILAASEQLNIAYQFRVFSSKRELCCVMENKNEAIGAAKTISGRLKVPRQNVVLSNTRIRQESVCRLGIGPVLTGHRNGFTNSFG